MSKAIRSEIASCSMPVTVASAGEKLGERNRYVTTGRPMMMASRPGPSPPYHALIITAATNKGNGGAASLQRSRAMAASMAMAVVSKPTP